MTCSVCAQDMAHERKRITTIETQQGRLAALRALDRLVIVALEADKNRFFARAARERANVEQLRENKRLGLQRDLKYLSENKLSLLRQTVYTPEQYAQQVDSLETQLVALEQEQERPAEEKLEAILRFSELIFLAQQSYEKAKPEQKRRLLLWVSSELVVAGREIAGVSANPGFQEMLASEDKVLSGSDGTRTRNFRRDRAVL